MREYAICAGHFEARTEWLATMSGDEAIRASYEIRADRFLDAARAAQERADHANDAAMVVMGGRTDIGPIVDEARLTFLTGFAETGQTATSLPACADDSVCAYCMDLLQSLSP